VNLTLPQNGEPDHIKCTAFIRPARGEVSNPSLHYVIALYVSTPRNTDTISPDSLFTQFRTARSGTAYTPEEFSYSSSLLRRCSLRSL
jgi:hypothetical protein